MFTLEQIKTAHSKVKSGADFPAFIREIKNLGVTFYETFVRDGHTDYYGINDYKTSTATRYEALVITNNCDIQGFKSALKEHQQGKTDYPTFVRMSAQMGIEKWAVCMEEMTCTYFDKKGDKVLTEEIPH